MRLSGLVGSRVAANHYRITNHHNVCNIAFNKFYYAEKLTLYPKQIAIHCSSAPGTACLILNYLYESLIVRSRDSRSQRKILPHLEGGQMLTELALIQIIRGLG